MNELGFELVKAFIILDDTGNRICAKYYTDDLKEQAQQSALLSKLPRRCDSTESNVQIIDNRLIVFKGSPGGVIFYCVGAETENEMILTAVLEGAFTTLDQLLRHSLDARTLLDNLELVLLTVDEGIDDGVILEIDPKEAESWLRSAFSFWCSLLSLSFIRISISLRSAFCLAKVFQVLGSLAA